MHPRFRIPLIIGIAAATVALVAASALGGNVKRFDSTVTLAATNPFHGHVSSPKHACEVNRTVKVFQQKYGTDGLYGKTTTDADGKWSIPASPNGKFYAKVTRRATTKFVCKPDTSPTRQFTG